MLCWGELGSGSGLNPCSHSEEILKGERVQHVCSQEGVTVFVLENGKVYTKTCGRKQKSKSGQFSNFKDRKIHFADSGTSHILFLSKAGSLFQSKVKSWKTAAKTETFSIMKPQLLKDLSARKIIQVACGNSHSLALTKDGQLFAWGQNTYGQLGLGTKDACQHIPELMVSLPGMPVAQITAGGEHSFALSLSGAVFGWGRNNHGQLGLKDTEDRYEPKHVKLLEGKRIIYISCGEEHTAVLTKDGLVFTFGAGSYGQLGHNFAQDETKPHLLGYLFGKKVSQIACGSYHTLAFVPSSGKIYSFGRGEKGQLGNGETRDQLLPLPINIMGTSGKRTTGNGRTTEPVIKRIFAGGNQSFAVCSDEVDLLSIMDHFSHITSKRIITVDNFLEKQLCKERRKAISEAFSCSQTLSGSFLEVRKDGHFKTNGEMSGLNLSAVSRGIEYLAKNCSLLQKVKNAVQHNLIPSLPRSPTCVETLRVYIIIPELIAILTQPRDSAMLLESLNRAILSLEEDYFKILECWWRTMPDDFFMRLVAVYQKESNRFHQLALAKASKDDTRLHDALKILQALSKVNSSRHAKIPDRNFCIPVMENLTDSVMAFLEKWFLGNFQAMTDQLMSGNAFSELKVQQFFSALLTIQHQLFAYPCVFDMETKLQILQMELNLLVNLKEPIHLQVSREVILQNALEGLKSSRSTPYCAELKVMFEGESCYGKGITQEFFTLLSRELLGNGRIFQRSKDSGLLWFPNEEPEMDVVIHLMGILCGLAVSNCLICNFNFPLALYKKLLHVPPTLEDLKELSPTEGNSLQEVLDYEYDDIEELLCLDFTVSEETADGNRVIKELIPNGINTPVQKHNRKQYVDAYVDYKLNTSVKKQFEAFSQGFRKSALPVVDIFLPEELRNVIQGQNNFEWELLKQNARYKGYSQTDKTVRNFWEVFEQLPKEKKLRFLAFLSGSERIPVGGFQNFSIMILNTKNEEPDSSYPRAYTCDLILDLPNYSCIEILAEKLLHAMESCEEFNAQELQLETVFV
ncbi:probable E3 ubiquitin-protein ligase HERC3 [Rhincodon typus]|uniref:probable E3 ubiquitin-protein ligase HERC3 n=1 Tax=Rhincodon typus TaxID=259920 RepID=UPI002030C730|nr:probable E3 ubiquitin-protein ligase HERC3 [Rhincodon typus]